MHPYPIHTRLLTGFILCGSYAGDHSYHEFISAINVSCPKDSISQDSPAPIS